MNKYKLRRILDDLYQTAKDIIMYEEEWLIMGGRGGGGGILLLGNIC